jgi:four helix bundle protein
MQAAQPLTPRLDHENLDVYRCAAEFLALALRVAGSLPRGEAELRDQLKRAAISIVLNIAEGSGKPTAADRARFHAIARGSAMECGALIDVYLIAGWIEATQAEYGKGLLVRIVSMLTRMCR